MEQQVLVNPQITDSVTQSSVQVMAGSPSAALSMAYQMLAQAVGMSMQGLTSHQGSMHQIGIANTAVAVRQILKMGR